MSWWYDKAVQIDLDDVTLTVHVEGAGPLAVLCHGFPELGYSWRHQVPMLVDAGFRVAVPDMRGYGRSDRPEEVSAYCAGRLADDIVGIINALSADDAVLIGHDWGASAVWYTASAYPDRVRAVGGLSVPPVPRAPAPPIEILRRRLGEDHYLIWFQRPGPADSTLAADVRRTLTATAALDPAWAAASAVAPRPPWWTEEDLSFYVEAFVRTGFTPGLNYYRNIDRNWAQAARLDAAPIEQPSLFLTGSDDLVAGVMGHASLDAVLPGLRVCDVITGAGHWLMQERPDDVNKALHTFVSAI